MTKKEKCLQNISFAYYSGYGGIELKQIEYGIEDYVYWIDNARYPSKGIRYHKSKIYYEYSGKSYFRAWSSKIYLDDCIRM